VSAGNRRWLENRFSSDAICEQKYRSAGLEN
jgi:hypothetical protein